MPTPRTWTESAIVAAVLHFYERQQRWPTRQDFTPTQDLPSLTVVTRRMQTWQESVRLAQHAASWTAVLLLLWLCAAPAGAQQTYYVSPSGNDANACQSARNRATSAKRTLQAGCTCLAPGDTLVVEDGQYHEQIASSANEESPTPCIPPAGLSPTQRTTIRAARPHQAILDKPSAGPPVNRVVTLDTTANLSLEGLVFDGRGHGTCVWLGPANNIQLKGNVIRNCGGNGVYASVDDQGGGGTGIDLLGNEITNVSLEYGPQPGNHGIYHVGNQSRIAGNHIHAPCPHY